MWEKVKLGDVCTIFGGYAFKSDQYIKNAVPLVRISNITENQIILDEECSIEENSKYSQFEILKGDILVALSGATTGKFGVFNFNSKAYVNQRVALIRKTEKTCQKFIFYYLNQIKEDILRKAGGAAQPNISTSELGKFEIPLPPLSIQKRIAEILEKADELRRKDKDLQAKYDELAQAIFIDMFGDPVRNERGWEVKNIEQLTTKEKHSIKRGPFGGALKKEIFVEDGYLVYEQYHALNNDFSMERYFIDEEKYRELIAFKVLPKDIIISCSGVYLGKLAIVPGNAKEGIINQALLKIRLNEQVMRNDFFVFHFTQKNFREKYFDANRGAGIPNFPPMPEFKRFPFITPPIHLQEAFARKIELINQLKAQTNAEKSEELFQSLLQKAFKGELVK